MFLCCLLLLALFLTARVLYLLVVGCPSFRKSYKPKPWNKVSDGRVKSIVVLGSGGHTTEMLSIVSKLSPKLYSKYYVIASSDKRSYDKVKQTEANLDGSEYELIYIPRSREVGQSWFTTCLTTLVSLVVCMRVVWRIRPHLVLCNGPGTCIPVAFSAWSLRILFLADPRILFIESLCRVKSLSMSGKIMRYLADELLVQWPELREKYPDTQYIGRL